MNYKKCDTFYKQEESCYDNKKHSFICPKLQKIRKQLPIIGIWRLASEQSGFQKYPFSILTSLPINYHNITVRIIRQSSIES